MWEEAIILGKELAEQYENEMFDFEQLSASLVSMHTVTSEVNHLIHQLNFCCFRLNMWIKLLLFFSAERSLWCVWFDLFSQECVLAWQNQQKWVDTSHKNACKKSQMEKV